MEHFLEVEVILQSGAIIKKLRQSCIVERVQKVGVILKWRVFHKFEVSV